LLKKNKKKKKKNGGVDIEFTWCLSSKKVGAGHVQENTPKSK
jgi:hypothetical protein